MTMFSVQFEDARRFARANPISHQFWTAIYQCPALLEPFSFVVNDKYYVVLTYCQHRIQECPIDPPFWHVQVAIILPADEINLALRLQGKPLTVSQDALLALQSWSLDDSKEANDIAMEILEPLMVRASQQGHVHGGLWETHVFLSAIPEHEKYADAH